MQSSALTAVLLPIALGVIMLGLGLGLGLDDFKRVVRYPKAAVLGLGCQMLVLPFVAYGIAVGLDLPPELAVGLMLLAASPGGATANLMSHLARGDVALNITLTAVNSVLSLATLPLIVNLSMRAFLGEGAALPLVLDKVIQVFAIVLIPVGLGMVLRARAPARARQLERPVKLVSLVFLVLVVVGAILGERDRVGGYFQQVGLAALLFNLASLAVGYGVPRLVGLERRQSISIGMEIGIHNSTLAIAIASGPTLLDNGTMAIPAAIYSLIMFFTAGAFAAIVSRGEPTRG